MFTYEAFPNGSGAMRESSNVSTGLSHATLIVRDPTRAAVLFERIMNAERVHDGGGNGTGRSHEIFLVIGGTWLALVEGTWPECEGYGHLAFRINDFEYDERLARVRAMDLKVEPSRPRKPGEGRSIYFRDYDNHLIELHTGTLRARLDALRAEKEAHA